MKVLEASVNFVKAKKVGGLAFNTIKNYENRINNFVSFLKSNKIENIEDVDDNLFVRFLTRYKNKRSRSVVSVIIKGFLTFSKVEIITNSPTYELPDIKSAKDEDIQQILKDETPFEKALVSLMTSSGLRATEVINLKIGDLDFETNRGKVISKGMNKDEKPDIFIFDDQTKAFLLGYLGKRLAEKAEFVFLDDGTQWSYYKLWGYFKNNFNFRPHQLRHSFCVKGAEILTPMELQVVARHKNYQTTQRYLYPDKEQFIASAQRKNKEKEIKENE